MDRATDHSAFAEFSRLEKRVERSEAKSAAYERLEGRDPEADALFDRMNRSVDPAEQRRIMRRFEKRVLDEEAHMFVSIWTYRIIPHRSVVRGWKINPSHYLNQSLENIWLDK